MKKGLFLFCAVFCLSIALSACSTDKDKNENVSLKNKISSLENEVKDLKAENNSQKNQLDKYTSMSMNYVVYSFKKRFVTKDIPILILPIDKVRSLNIIKANTVIDVIDAVINNKNEFWLYVSIPVYDTPVNYKGWIKEADTAPYTKDKEKLVQSEVTFKKGVSYYNVTEFKNISNDTLKILEENTRGRIIEKKGGYSFISVPGGVSFWIKDKYVILPQPEG